MTKTIWKYSVKDDGDFTAKIPRGATYLSVQTQAGAPMMWFLVDPDADMEVRQFRVVGTGWAFDPNRLSFLGTYQLHGGDFVFHFVFHLFERVER